MTQIGGRLGGVLGPAAFGLLVTHTSYTTAWLSAALVILSGERLLQTSRQRGADPLNSVADRARLTTLPRRTDSPDAAPGADPPPDRQT